jgi:hypothetical protein
MAMRILEALGLVADLDLASACPMVKVESEHTLAPSFQRKPTLPQSALVSGWLKVSAHTLAPSFQRMPALSQSAPVNGWLEVSAANRVEDPVGAAVEVGSAHTLAPSFQRMPPLSQSALVSGWTELSAANTIEANTKALANPKIETIAFIDSVHKLSKHQV